MDGQVGARGDGHDDVRGARARGQDNGHVPTAGGARPGGHAPASVPVPVEGHVGMLDDVPVPVRVVLGVLLAVMLAATGIGFLLSYESLHRLADGHGLHGRAAWIWPSSVDSFIGIGELGTAAFLWLRHGADRWWRRVPWPFVAITGLGFVGSLTANLAEAGTDPAARLVASVPPVAALAAFAGVAYLGHALLQRWQGHAHVPVPAVPPAVSVPQSVLIEPASAPVHAALPAAPPPVPVPASPRAPARQSAAARAPARSKVVVPLPTGDDLEAERARARRIYAESMVAGTPLTVAEMIAEMGKSERWHKTQRAAVGRTIEDARAYLGQIES